MAKEYFYKIITDLDKLSTRSKEVDWALPKTKIRQDIKMVKQTLKSHPELCCLAAPQLGLFSRIFGIKFANNKIKIFVNPMITHSDELHFSRETNPSLPSEYIILRHNTVVAMYQNEDAKIEENKFEGMAAELFQQMCDMLDGVTLDDYGLDLAAVGGVEAFDAASEEDRQEVLKYYAESLKEREKEIEATIEADPKLKAEKQYINFMEAVATGKVDLVPENEQGDLDFEHSSKATIQAEEKMQKQYQDLLKKKVEEIRKRGSI